MDDMQMRREGLSRLPRRASEFGGQRVGPAGKGYGCFQKEWCLPPKMDGL